MYVYTCVPEVNEHYGGIAHGVQRQRQEEDGDVAATCRARVVTELRRRLSVIQTHTVLEDELLTPATDMRSA